MNAEKESCRIVSLALNPAIDLTYTTDELRHDQKSRSSNTRLDPGGTGINVGRALERLGADCHTCSTVAGSIGHLFQELVSQQIKHLTLLPISGETRINTTILEQTRNQQFEINAEGPAVSDAQLTEIITQFLKLCSKGIGILTGSLLKGSPTHTYQIISSAIQQQGGKAVIDAPVHLLQPALQSQPYLIKPNRHELECLCQQTLPDLKSIAAQSRQLVDQGIRYVCVSLGDAGALLSNTDHSYFCTAPSIPQQSSVGCGDALLAGLVYALNKGMDDKEALQWGVACGTATAARPGTELFDIQDLPDLIHQCDVKTLN
jgi:6-phosphofructokinase 2